ncbi:MFS transporter [Streptomyces sp. NPDC005790]|uniref:MFS transporter n=1 Tax=Streptomyces sp. NPDC005790 TaxID=3154777 RepID=UPI0033D7AD16
MRRPGRGHRDPPPARTGPRRVTAAAHGRHHPRDRNSRTRCTPHPHAPRPDAASLLVAAPALGALLGSVFSGWLARIRRHGLAVLIAVSCWGGAIAVFGLTRQLWLGPALLALAGCADSISMVFRDTMLQAAAPDEMRGRLQGVFIVVVAGGPRLGDLVAGSVADLTSPAVAVTGGGIVCVLLVCLPGLRRRGFARYDAHDPQP